MREVDTIVAPRRVASASNASAITAPNVPASATTARLRAPARSTA
jgi:hypothetical protein